MGTSIEQRKVIKIFVGVGHYIEQKALENKRKKQRWTMGVLSTQKHMNDRINESDDAIVVLNGSHAGDCIPDLAKKAWHKAFRIVIPLPNIMGGEYAEGITGRARTLAQRLKKLDLDVDDKRLIVTPTSIWNKVKKDL